LNIIKKEIIIGIIMNLEDFIKKVEVEIEDLESGTLTADKDYREIEQWSSMYALILIAMIDTEYDVTLTGEDLKASITVRDLYDIVKSKR
jgi:acyl carrier protein